MVHIRVFHDNFLFKTSVITNTTTASNTITEPGFKFP